MCRWTSCDSGSCTCKSAVHGHPVTFAHDGTAQTESTRHRQPPGLVDSPCRTPPELRHPIIETRVLQIFVRNRHQPSTCLIVNALDTTEPTRRYSPSSRVPSSTAG